LAQATAKLKNPHIFLRRDIVGLFHRAALPSASFTLGRESHHQMSGRSLTIARALARFRGRTVRMPGISACAAMPRPVAVGPAHPRLFSAVAVAESDIAGVTFGDLLRYLQDQYGLAHQYVEDTLSELAQILGYEEVDSNTRIHFGDVKILMEEVGTSPATKKELRQFLAGTATSEVDSEPVDIDISEAAALEQYHQMHNIKDLMDFARKRGDKVEASLKHWGWMRLITAKGDVVLFKTVGKRDGSRSSAVRRHKPRSLKECEIRAYPEGSEWQRMIQPAEWYASE